MIFLMNETYNKLCKNENPWPCKKSAFYIKTKTTPTPQKIEIDDKNTRITFFQ